MIDFALLLSNLSPDSVEELVAWAEHDFLSKELGVFTRRLARLPRLKDLCGLSLDQATVLQKRSCMRRNPMPATVRRLLWFDLPSAAMGTAKVHARAVGRSLLFDLEIILARYRYASFPMRFMTAAEDARKVMDEGTYVRFLPCQIDIRGRRWQRCAAQNLAMRHLCSIS